MAYLPIEHYGIIGNMRTAALVGLNGSIDWYCFPHFDSPSLFAAILDDGKGGRFRISPVNVEARTKQFYWPDTNVLITRFLSAEGVAEIEDFMPVGIPNQVHQLVRRLKVSRGSIEFDLVCEPGFDYARIKSEVTVTSSGAIFTTPALTMGLSSSVPLKRTENGVRARFKLEAGEHAVFILHQLDSSEGDCMKPPSRDNCEMLFESTVGYWRRWLSKSRYKGRWREMINRSALALKLLTFQPTGAIIAAPTCSLPEEIGGVRNWDYRYTWIRDSAFTLYGLLRIGFTEEAAHFMEWLEGRSKEHGGDHPLQIVYGIDGRKELTEITLDHLEGYRGSAPVRIGNGAATQLQLDIYGELMDSVYLYNKYGSPISYELWTYLRRLLDWVAANWRQPDEGIWEVRSGRQHFVYSKLMCWVALDRGVRLAEKRSFPADRIPWLRERDAIYEAIMTQGWSEKRKAFIQYFGSNTLDASNLVMPLFFFLSPTDPKFLQTLEAIGRRPGQGGLMSDGLVYRYDRALPNDGLTGQEGTFNMCTFWMVEALTRAGQRDPAKLDEARLLFERMLGYANHLGLYSEETGNSGEALGNFPQGFTHLALISSAFNLDRALDERR